MVLFAFAGSFPRFPATPSPLPTSCVTFSLSSPTFSCDPSQAPSVSHVFSGVRPPWPPAECRSRIGCADWPRADGPLEVTFERSLLGVEGIDPDIPVLGFRGVLGSADWGRWPLDGVRPMLQKSVIDNDMTESLSSFRFFGVRGGVDIMQAG